MKHRVAVVSLGVRDGQFRAGERCLREDGASERVWAAVSIVSWIGDDKQLVGEGLGKPGQGWGNGG